MTVVLVLTELAGGGAERVVSLLANSLCNKGINVQLILITEGEQFYSIDSRIKIHVLGKKKGLRGLPRFVSIFKVVYQIYSIISRINADIVIASLFKPICYSTISCVMAKVPLINYIHSDPRAENGNFFRKHLFKLIYPFSQKIVVLNPEIKEYLGDKLTGVQRDMIEVMPNPIDERLFSENNEIEYENIPKGNYIISMGRLNPVKGFDKLIDAYKIFNEDCKDCSLIILGEGELREELQRKIYLLKLKNKIFMPGFVKHPAGLIKAAKFFVLTSQYEGFGNVLVESMALNTPCISFDCDSGPRHIIENGVNGYLVEQNNVVKLAETMTNLYRDDQKLTMISKEAGNVVNSFSEKDFVCKWQNIIKTIVLKKCKHG